MRISRRLVGLRAASLRVLALSALGMLVMLAAICIYSANGSAAPQECGPGTQKCDDGLCYPIGSVCCKGSGACAPGRGCWTSGGGRSFCCPIGTVGYTDGWCVPAGASDYCGVGRFCPTGRCCMANQMCC
jgi:hypothetical protein